MQDYFIYCSFSYISCLKMVENHDINLLGSTTGEPLRTFQCPLPQKRGWGLHTSIRLVIAHPSHKVFGSTTLFLYISIIKSIYIKAKYYSHVITKSPEP